MPKISSKLFKVFMVSGVDLLSVKPKAIADKVVNALQNDTHGLGDEWSEHSATGMLRGELSQQGGFFTTAANEFHQQFKAVTNLVRTVVYAPLGNTIGQMFVGWEGNYVGFYEVISNVGKLVEANAGYAVTGAVDRGLIVQDWVTKAADFNTNGTPTDYTTDPTNLAIPITSNTQANPSVITTPVPHRLTTGDVILIAGVTGSSPTINGERTVTVLSSTTFSVPVNTSAGSAGTGGSFLRCSSNNGGVGYQSVSDCSGFTNFVGKLEHSADNVSYATLITFADNVVAPYAERKTVTGTVHRYVRFNGDVTGAGSIKPFAGFKRNAPQ